MGVLSNKRVRGILKQFFPYAIEVAYIRWRYGLVMRYNQARPGGLLRRVGRALSGVLPFGLVLMYENYQMTRGETGLYGFAERLGLFDRAWYMANNPDVDFSKIDPLPHFFTIGWLENRDPSPFFCVSAYLKRYADVMELHMNPLEHFLRRGRWEGRSPCGATPLPKNKKVVAGVSKRDFLRRYAGMFVPYWVFQTYMLAISGVKFPSKARSVRRTFALSPRRTGRVAVFAVYSSNAVVSETTLHYLRGLKKVVDNIVLVADNPVIPSEVEKLRDLVCRCEFKRHGEYDFGSYKRGWRYVMKNAELAKTDELVFCNDSCFGPVTDFAPVFSEMDARGVDFWGMCDNEQIEHHIQSYFLCFSKAVFSSGVFGEFMESIRMCPNVNKVVMQYEVPFTSTLEAAGFRGEAFIGYGEGVLRGRERFGACPVHYPVTLLELGMPLVKVKAFKWVKCNMEGVDVTRAAVARMNPELAALIDAEVPPVRPAASFSVIMPTYNRADRIAGQLDALLRQTYGNFEIVVVDDGSTDGTEEFIRGRYAAELADGRIKYFYKKNEGVCQARNFGLVHASREWIAYADSDNEVFPYFLEMFARTIAENPESRTFYGRFRMNDCGAVIGKEFSFEQLVRGNFIDLGVFVHHRSVTDTCGAFDVEMTRLVDWDLILRYTEKFPPVYIPQLLMIYDDRDDSARISTRRNYAVNLNHMRLKRGPSFIVTTIITAYNHEKYIARALESAMRQKGDFVHEIIVSSDGSTDGTREVIRMCQRRCPMIRDLSEDVNVGVSANMKRCFDAANGRYIAVLEGDDYWCSNEKLARQVAFMEAHPDFSMVFCRINVLNDKTGGLSLLPRQSGLREALSGEDFVNDPNQNLIANFSCCLFSTWAIRKLPPEIYSERFNEITLAFSIEQLGPIGFLPNVMTTYRIHPGSVWSTADRRRQLESGIRIRELALRLAAPRYRERLQKIIDERREQLAALGKTDAST